MPESSNFVQHDEGDDGAHWRVDHCAVAAERLTSSNGAVRAVMLRHPTYPFRGRVDGVDLERGLRRIAAAYLEAIRERAAIPQAVLDALASDDPAFGWLPIAWGDDALAPARRDPRQSSPGLCLS